MQLRLDHPIHLTYCTNIHPGETWEETFANIQNYTARIRDRVAPGRRFGIGLRLSELASRELQPPHILNAFKDYLARNNFYVFTINGFPYGQFHGTKVKEKVFAPDWTTAERLAYTKRLGDILAELLPDGMEGSISTSPGSFEEWITSRDQIAAMVMNFAECALHLRRIQERAGKLIHLGLEPEPMGFIETVDETVDFFQSEIHDYGASYLKHQHDAGAHESHSILAEHLGMCYDTCHMAIEYENAGQALEKLRRAGIKLSKVQVSSALKLRPTEQALTELERFADATYLHQVLARRNDGTIERWKDIRPALAERERLLTAEELRVHCHVPLYMTEHRDLDSTSGHIEDLLAALTSQNDVAHFEIETYTWDVLPPELRRESIDEAVADEFTWFLKRLNCIEQQSI